MNLELEMCSMLENGIIAIRKHGEKISYPLKRFYKPIKVN